MLYATMLYLVWVFLKVQVYSMGLENSYQTNYFVFDKKGYVVLSSGPYYPVAVEFITISYFGVSRTVLQSQCFFLALLLFDH